MKAASKRAALRSLNLVLWELRERLRFREEHPPKPGTVEMGHMLGLQDGCTRVANEIRRITRLKVNKP